MCAQLKDVLGEPLFETISICLGTIPKLSIHEWNANAWPFSCSQCVKTA